MHIGQLFSTLNLHQIESTQTASKFKVEIEFYKTDVC